MKKLSAFIAFCCLNASLLPGLCAEHATYDEARAAARKNAEAKDYGAARKDLEQAVTLTKDPDEKSEALMLIGETFKREDKRTEARQIWQKVLDAPDTPDEVRWAARMSMGTSYSEEKKYAEARAEFVKALEDKKHDPGTDMRMAVQFFIGLAYIEEKNYTEARKSFNQILLGDLAKEMWMFRLMVQKALAESYQKEDNHIQARAEHQKIVDVAIDDTTPADTQKGIESLKVMAQRDIAKSYFQENNYAQAKKAYQTLLAMKEIGDTNKADAEKQLKLIEEKEKEQQAKPHGTKTPEAGK